MLEENIKKEIKKYINGETERPFSVRDVIDLQSIIDNMSMINSQNKSYQREEVASKKWKQGIVKTIVEEHYIKIPEIHVSVEIGSDNEIKQFEIMDGQQRFSAIREFLESKVSIPSDISNKNWAGKKLNELNITDQNKILQYHIAVVYYIGITPLQKANLFTEVLNNVNTMKPQEIRNAVSGAYSTFIRDVAREDGRKAHRLFTRVTVEDKKKSRNKKPVPLKDRKKRLKYFCDKFTLNGRMEADEWLSELVYLVTNDMNSGVSNASHNKWVKRKQSQSETDNWQNSFLEEPKIIKLLDTGLSLFEEIEKLGERKILTNQCSMTLLLYCLKWERKNYFVDHKKFAKGFVEVYKKWDDIKTKIFLNHTFALQKDRPLERFSDLFRGKNSNSMQTIFWILDKEFEKNQEKYGLLEVDIPTFRKIDIEKKWEEQGRKDYWTGFPIKLEHCDGDHIIPRSFGKKYGGVTKYSNLAVTDSTFNKKRGNKSAAEWIKHVERYIDHDPQHLNKLKEIYLEKECLV